MEGNVDEVWRIRFNAYTPLQLVDFILGPEPEHITRLAGEALDEKLIAMGCQPRKSAS